MLTLPKRLGVWMDYGAAMFVVEKIRQGGMFTDAGYDDEEKNEIVAQAYEFLIDSLCDATHVGIIQVITKDNIRDHVSVDVANELHDEIRLRRFSRRN